MNKVPIKEIGELLAQAMKQACENGANSVSMPDEYVAIAHWLAYPEQYTGAVAIPVKIDATDAIKAVVGMQELVIEGTKMVKWAEDMMEKTGSAPTKHYYELKAALTKIGEVSIEPTQVAGDGSFFNLNGVSVTPDIEEDLGRMMVEIVAAFDFIKNGPVINMPTVDLDKMFDDKVWKLTPRIQTLVANRVMAKHPFSVLADMFSQGGMPAGISGSQRFYHAVGKIEETMVALPRVNPKTDAKEVMDCLAYIATYMQVVMNLYGWSWDDVKLKARQQMATAEGL